MNEDAYIDDAAVYRLAAAIVKGMQADDPELAEWRRWGEGLRERLNAQPQARVVGARGVGRMVGENAVHERLANAVDPGRRRREKRT